MGKKLAVAAAAALDANRHRRLSLGSVAMCAAVSSARRTASPMAVRCAGSGIAFWAAHATVYSLARGPGSGAMTADGAEGGGARREFQVRINSATSNLLLRGAIRSQIAISSETWNADDLAVPLECGR